MNVCLIISCRVMHTKALAISWPICLPSPYVNEHSMCYITSNGVFAFGHSKLTACGNLTYTAKNVHNVTTQMGYDTAQISAL